MQENVLVCIKHIVYYWGEGSWYLQSGLQFGLEKKVHMNKVQILKQMEHKLTIGKDK